MFGQRVSRITTYSPHITHPSWIDYSKALSLKALSCDAIILLPANRFWWKQTWHLLEACLSWFLLRSFVMSQGNLPSVYVKVDPFASLRRLIPLLIRLQETDWSHIAMQNRFLRLVNGLIIDMTLNTTSDHRVILPAACSLWRRISFSGYSNQSQLEIDDQTDIFGISKFKKIIASASSSVWEYSLLR